MPVEAVAHKARPERGVQVVLAVEVRAHQLVVMVVMVRMD